MKSATWTNFSWNHGTNLQHLEGSLTLSWQLRHQSILVLILPSGVSNFAASEPCSATCLAREPISRSRPGWRTVSLLAYKKPARTYTLVVLQSTARDCNSTSCGVRAARRSFRWIVTLLSAPLLFPSALFKPARFRRSAIFNEWEACSLTICRLHKTRYEVFRRFTLFTMEPVNF